MNFDVRPMVDADADAIHAIHTQCLLQTLSAHYRPEQIAAWLKGRTPQGYLDAAKEGERFFVAQAQDEVVGFSSWRDGELLALYVHPDAQKQGVGAQLFEVCLQDALNQGAYISILKAAKGAEAFYLRRGFEAHGQGLMTKEDSVIEYTHMGLGADAWSSMLKRRDRRKTLSP